MLSSQKKKSPAGNHLSCPFTLHGISCPEVFHLRSTTDIHHCLDHWSFHVQQLESSSNFLSESLEKLRQYFSVPLSSGSWYTCPVSYCLEKFHRQQYLVDHFKSDHVMDMVAMHLVDVSQKSLLARFFAYCSDKLRTFVATYERIAAGKAEGQAVAGVRHGTSDQSTIQIENCFSVCDLGQKVPTPPRSGRQSGTSKDGLGEGIALAVSGLGGGAVPPPSEDEDVEIVAAVATISTNRSDATDMAAPPGAKSPGIVFVPARKKENLLF
jgi:hypothetical protein